MDVLPIRGNENIHSFKLILFMFCVFHRLKIHILDDKLAQIVSNHPVHLVDEYGQSSPSALIPFCEFGGHLELLGYKMMDLQLPLCTAFNKRILNGQLCYEVDVNKHRSEPFTREELREVLKITIKRFFD